MDDIGKALGINYRADEELKGGDEVAERDRHRWELIPRRQKTGRTTKTKIDLFGAAKRFESRRLPAGRPALRFSTKPARRRAIACFLLKRSSARRAASGALDWS